MLRHLPGSSIKPVLEVYILIYQPTEGNPVANKGSLKSFCGVSENFFPGRSPATPLGFFFFSGIINGVASIVKRETLLQLQGDYGGRGRKSCVNGPFQTLDYRTNLADKSFPVVFSPSTGVALASE